MNYIKITECDVVNGLEVGVVLWVSGCRCGCKGCYNQESWNFYAGQPYTKETEEYIIELFKNKPYYTRLTLSGGHPFEPENRQTCEELCRKIKEQCPNVKIWAYSGLYWDDIKHLDIIKDIDVLVDGPFVANLFDENLMWRGSSNQSVIDVKQSLLNNEKVILSEVVQNERKSR